MRMRGKFIADGNRSHHSLSIHETKAMPLRPRGWAHFIARSFAGGTLISW